jgi:hypothetical protein
MLRIVPERTLTHRKSPLRADYEDFVRLAVEGGGMAAAVSTGGSTVVDSGRGCDGRACPVGPDPGRAPLPPGDYLVEWRIAALSNRRRA